MTRPPEKLEDLLAARRTLVVGVGNPLRGDDAVGPRVARTLAERRPGRALDAGAVPENYLGPILRARPELVLFVDAAELGGAPGTWRLAAVDELEASCSSTHHASLGLLARVLESEGVACRLLGVQPAGLEPGAALAPAVAEAAAHLAARLERALDAGAVHA